MAGRRVVVVIEADENYALGAAVTGRSALDGRPSDSSTEIVVLDAGLTKETRARLRESWGGADPVSFRAVAPDRRARLRLGRLFPEHDRVVYLDADTLVLGDLGAIADRASAGAPVAAVQDTMIPWMRDDDLPPGYGHMADEPYFNSGVLVLDLAAWRAAGIDEEAEAAEKWGHRFWSHNQQALNLTFGGRWVPLGLTWNRMTHVLAIPSWRSMCFPAEEVADAVAQPQVVHFAGREKPWLGDCGDDRVPDWFAALDRTAWAGWRPPTRSAAFRAWEAAVRRPHGRYDFVRRGLRLARREGDPRTPWWGAAARIAAGRPWTVATYPMAKVRYRLRRGPAGGRRPTG